jgi:predicted lipoprotein
MRPQIGLAIVMATTLLWGSVVTARAEADHAAIAKASLTQVIRPGYAAFADATGALEDKLDALCAQPSSDALSQAKDAFAAAVAAWSKVEIIRFGPVIEDHRFERLFFWPDPKGIGLRQIQDALAKQDGAVTEPNQLADKSVALQGLPALEYLLYGDGADALAAAPKVEDGQQPLPDLDDPAQFRCSFAASVATKIDRAAKACPGKASAAALEARLMSSVRRSRLMASLHPWH